jgi:hypothetical protein
MEVISGNLLIGLVHFLISTEFATGVELELGRSNIRVLQIRSPYEKVTTTWACSPLWALKMFSVQDFPMDYRCFQMVKRSDQSHFSSGRLETLGIFPGLPTTPVLRYTLHTVND